MSFQHGLLGSVCTRLMTASTLSVVSGSNALGGSSSVTPCSCRSATIPVRIASKYAGFMSSLMRTVSCAKRGLSHCAAFRRADASSCIPPFRKSFRFRSGHSAEYFPIAPSQPSSVIFLIAGTSIGGPTNPLRIPDPRGCSNFSQGNFFWNSL